MAGQAIRVHFTGTEDQVIPTYDQLETLIASARLTQGKSFEIYYDDPAATGGSVNRDIFYLIEGDASALARVAPSAGAVPAAGDASAGAVPVAALAPQPAVDTPREPIATPEPTRSAPALQADRQACLVDLRCVATCYRYDSEEGSCPTRAQQIERLFKEGSIAFKDPPSEMELGSSADIVFSVVKTDVAVTPETQARREKRRPAREADDNAAVEAARAESAAPATPIVTQGLALAPFLSAELLAPGFEALPSSPAEERRSCRVGTTCTWRWTVRAIESGEHTITVRLNGFVSEDQVSREPIESYDHHMRVKANALGMAAVLISDTKRDWVNILGLAASIAGIFAAGVAIVDYFGKRRLRNSPLD